MKVCERSLSGPSCGPCMSQEECNDPFEANNSNPKEQNMSNNHYSQKEVNSKAYSSNSAKQTSQVLGVQTELEPTMKNANLIANETPEVNLLVHNSSDKDAAEGIINAKEVPSEFQGSSSSELETSVVGNERINDGELVLDSLNGKDDDEECNETNDDIEDLETLHSTEGQEKDYDDQKLENFTQIHAAIKTAKGKKKRKSIDEILGFTKTQRKGKGKGKCAVMRTAVAAAALSASLSSMSLQGINNRNRIILDEAQAIWELNKLNNIGYEGDEVEVISKLVEIESQRCSRAACNP